MEYVCRGRGKYGVTVLSHPSELGGNKECVCLSESCCFYYSSLLSEPFLTIFNYFLNYPLLTIQVLTIFLLFVT